MEDEKKERYMITSNLSSQYKKMEDTLIGKNSELEKQKESLREEISIII